MKRLIQKPIINLGHNNLPVNPKSLEFTNSAIEKLKIEDLRSMGYKPFVVDFIAMLTVGLVSIITMQSFIKIFI